jgi:hypothetical protein
MSAKKAGKSRARKQTSSSEAARKTRPKGKGVKGRPLSPLEVQLRKTMAEMGLARARRVFASVEAAFDD